MTGPITTTPSAIGDIDKIFAASPSDLTTAGGLWIAPAGTTLPTDVDEPLNAAFKNFGFVSDKGVKLKIDSKTKPIEVWGGDEIGSLRDKFAVEYSMALFQVLSPHVNAAIFGSGSVSTAAATAQHGERMKVMITSKIPPKCALVLDTVFEDKLIRQVAALAQLSDLADLTFVHNEPLALEPTFRVIKNPADGAHIVQYSDDGKVSV
ncbi:phage tail protein [Tsukamurella asaccharolytica]|uniref:Phage tail protein n=1 Tax=Tsukamurella asaccharolytica TaxID=2592067 RepID=A0A5C5RDN5_9ACTN|nr:phage tail protein [Tsukamurella asaccharolytica]TWS20778.1 phage tail protein [Tsukamurella asaccharolytica]